jgi:hypothetical protein
MLTTLLNVNNGLAGNAGGASAGAPVASVGTTATAGGGGYRHFGASYDYNEPEVLAAREEVKLLRKEKRKVKKQDNSGAMLEAIEKRLQFLYKLLEEKKAGYIRTQERYEYEARMKQERREKRMRRIKTISKLLN